MTPVTRRAAMPHTEISFFDFFNMDNPPSVFVGAWLFV
jgi:hypothetical protein